MSQNEPAGTATLVLGAGGVVGHSWHAGVLAALAEATGWDARRAEVVIGTSAGSVVGALLRAGIGPADLFARATGEQVSDEGRRLLADAGMTKPPTDVTRPVPRRAGPASPRLLARTALTPWRVRPGLLVAGGLPRGGIDPGIAGQVGRLFPSGWPTEPFWVCAVRLDDGRRVAFGRERERTDPVDVGTAVAASCAIPGWFTPVSIGRRDFVDGGTHSPTNADLAGDGPGVVVVSSPMSLDRAALRRLSPQRLLRVSHRATLLREVAKLRRQGRAVITLQPGPEDLAAMGGTADAMDSSRRSGVARTARETTLRRLGTPALAEALARLG